jgi:hypothetical protein
MQTVCKRTVTRVSCLYSCPNFQHATRFYFFNLNHWVMHPVARVSTNIVETSVRNKCRCSFKKCTIKRAPTFVAYGGFYNISRFYLSVSLKYTQFGFVTNSYFMTYCCRVKLPPVWRRVRIPPP